MIKGSKGAPLVTTADAAQLDEIGDLFDQIMHKELGCVTSTEMAAILPYAAGAAKADVQRLIDEMATKKLALNKKQFVRFVAKKTYGAWNAHMEQLENAPLAHVIVSMKRRKHLVQFSNFYLSKGVAGAELVVPVETDNRRGKASNLAARLDGTSAPHASRRKHQHRDAVHETSAAHAATAAAAAVAASGTTDKSRLTKDQLHEQWMWVRPPPQRGHNHSQSQRKSLVQQCRVFKTAYQHVYAIVFNVGTHALERHCIYLTYDVLICTDFQDQEYRKPYVRLYSSRYFCIAMAPDRDHQVIASSAYMGQLYHDRKQSCHGPAPDMQLAMYFLSPDRHAKATNAPMSYPAALPLATSDRPLWTEPIPLFHDVRADFVSCTYGNLNFVNAGRLYEWGLGPVLVTPKHVKPMYNPTHKSLHPVCFYPTLDDVHHVDPSPYQIAPRHFHKAIHEYSMWISRNPPPDQHSNDNNNSHDDSQSTACAIWADAKIRMGPHQIQRSLSDMQSVVSGGYFYAAIARNGELYVWGKGEFGRLATAAPDSGFLATPQKLHGFKHPIRIVACGAMHVLCADSHGHVYSWGGNLHGQLGTGLTDDTKQPDSIAFLRDKRAIDVVAGDDHSLVLTDVGDVYSFGNNWCGQLGQGNPTTLFSPIPAHVNFPQQHADPIYMIRSIGVTCAAVSVTGSVFQWGLCAVPLCGLVSRYDPQLLKYETISCVTDPRHVGVPTTDANHVVTSLALSAGCVVLGISTTGTYDAFYTHANDIDVEVPSPHVA
ncbi:Aste57867_14875 [Aphanomyces stellatus]|uniref:Aste57867_14875 protein n=1 Tax=Aphanomyces stellatus TaxID=120398 RepID=A0A485L3J9_9STRA|nr:hypothetical protein As57867_014819 [Aphanomyces stellatus]VFT91692.1 Aste57867_14875 [Aphanomyces stellatus]